MIQFEDFWQYRNKAIIWCANDISRLYWWVRNTVIIIISMQYLTVNLKNNNIIWGWDRTIHPRHHRFPSLGKPLDVKQLSKGCIFNSILTPMIDFIRLTGELGTPSSSISASHASPIPSLSASSCPLFGTDTQLSWNNTTVKIVYRILKHLHKKV